MGCDERAIQAFQGVLLSADPVRLLQLAESGGFGLDQTVAARAAAAAVCVALGFPLSQYRDSTQGIFVGLILGRLHDLSAAGYTTLASLSTDNPRGNQYSYFYS